MVFHQAVTHLKNHLDKIHSINSLRNFLIKKKLNLVVTITTDGFNAMDWNITQSQVAGVLNLAIKVRISSLINDRLFVETTLWHSVQLHRIDAIDQKHLFEILKSGLKTALKKQINEHK